MAHQTITSRHATGDRGTIRKYTVGFVLSILLTLGAYLLATTHTGIQTSIIIGAIMVLALVQLAVQLQFFIHLGSEPKPQWNKLVFFFMLVVVVILVGGTLWIMDNLHYNMMTPQETNTYMQKKEGIL